MKVVHLCLFVLVLVAVPWQASAGEISKDSKEVLGAGGRPKRQEDTSTTPKPKKPRPSNIFGLFSVLLTETRDDASRAFNEIGTLFNGQFANSTTTKAPTTTTSTTTPSSASSDSDEDNEITTTTEPYSITRNEFFGILRSNVQGLVNLFGKEFRVAIRDSNQNAREFGRDLGLALRQNFVNGNNNNNNNKTKSSS